ncbi:OmpA/MotB family protein [Desulfoplanes sp.]
MGRKQKNTAEEDGSPAWLVTFSDLMTLLLTFFVLLLSLASLVDERKTKVSLGSIMGAFGPGKGSVQPLTTKPTTSTSEPGPMEDVPSKDLEPLRELVWEEDGQDFDFQSNRFIQVFSVDTRILFGPGETRLSARGRETLQRLIPVFARVKYPLLITGHTGSLRSEFRADYVVGEDDRGVDLSWDLSLQRVLSVYRALLKGGVDPENVRMEGFGKFRPKATSTTPQGRRANRRVEFILDRRGSGWSHQMAREAGKGGALTKDTYMYHDFVFDLNATTGE